jgi:hypothetical protein
MIRPISTADVLPDGSLSKGDGVDISDPYSNAHDREDRAEQDQRLPRAAPD